MERKSYFISLALTTVLFCTTSYSQEKNSCLEELRRYEEFYNPKNDNQAEKQNIYFSYSVKVTNWDNETTVSNVKLYKQGIKMHFFSEQANIYIDEKEMLVTMPIQKIVVINSFVKGITDHKLGDSFYTLRKSFMDSCQVVKCENKSKNIKTLVLRVDPKKNNLDVSIDEITYEYNTESKKILSVKVNYNEDYKIKQLVMNYKDYSTESTYKYTSARYSVIDKKGKLLPAYKDFELVDNRDNENHSKRK